MKIYLVTLLTCIVVAVAFFSVGDSLTSDANTGSTGYLSVTVETDRQMVSVNDRFVGWTPLNRFELDTGEYIVKIGDYWEEKIHISKSYESVIYRQLKDTESSFVFGYSLSNDMIGGVFFPEPELVIDVDPVYAEVNLNGIDQTARPVYFNQSGEYTIRISAVGFQSLEINQKLDRTQQTMIQAKLMPDLFSNISQVSLPENTFDGISQDFAKGVNTRLEWKGSRVLLTENEYPKSPWNGMQIYATKITDDSSVSSFLEQVDSMTEFTILNEQDQPGEQITAIPFAFVVDKEGNVYEGVGLFDFDFSRIELSERLNTALIDLINQYKEGVAPILVVYSSEESILANQKIKEGLNFIKKTIENGPILTSNIITDVGEIRMEFGEERVVDFQWRNSSPTVWEKGSTNIWLVTKSGFPSIFYDALTWEKNTQVVTYNEDRVFPGELATFTLPIKAGYIPGKYQEDFILQSLNESKSVIGSDMVLKVLVVGETDKVLEIGSPTTGFASVRSGPSQSSDLVSTVYTGDQLAWTVEQDGWVEVIMQGGQKGWIQARNVIR